MAVNKVVYSGSTLIDLTGDTVTADTLLKDQTAHAANGTTITGTCTFDSDTSDATVQVAEMLTGKTGYARGAKLTGTMPNQGAQINTISEIDQSISIAAGYHDGSGYVQIDEDEQNKLLPQNIKTGVEILGVTGTLSPAENVTAQAKIITPSASQQTILPDDGTDYLSQVIVEAIPVTATENAAGGTTYVIG